MLTKQMLQHANVEDLERLAEFHKIKVRPSPFEWKYKRDLVDKLCVALGIEQFRNDAWRL